MVTILQDVAVGFGLLFFYSSAADVALVMAMESESEIWAVDAVVETITAVVNGLLSFLFFSAAAETIVPANFSGRR